jgi:hypothetical protein
MRIQWKVSSMLLTHRVLRGRFQPQPRPEGGLRRADWARRLTAMRNLDTIDSELRLLAAMRWSIREHGGEPSSPQVDYCSTSA